MAATKVTFQSGGFKLAGTVRVPDGVKPGERRPGVHLSCMALAATKSANGLESSANRCSSSSAMSRCASTCRAAARAKASAAI